MPVIGGHGWYWEQVPSKGWRKGHADLGLGNGVFWERREWIWDRRKWLRMGVRRRIVV